MKFVNFLNLVAISHLSTLKRLQRNLGVDEQPIAIFVSTISATALGAVRGALSS